MPDRLVKFGLTGGLGTVTNLLLFFLMADRFGLPGFPVSAACFVLCASQNYVVNQLWTFRATGGGRLSAARWGKFIVSSLAGYACNAGTYLLLTRLAVWQYKVIPQGISILAGMALNFVLSSRCVFGTRKGAAPPR